jgi:hypothetical protein
MPGLEREVGAIERDMIESGGHTSLHPVLRAWQPRMAQRARIESGCRVSA